MGLDSFKVFKGGWGFGLALDGLFDGGFEVQHSALVFSIFKMKIPYVVVADPYSLVRVVLQVTLLVHLTSGSKIDYRKDILGFWVFQKLVLRKLSILNKVCENTVQLRDLLGGVFPGCESLLRHAVVFFIDHDLLHFLIQFSQWLDKCARRLENGTHDAEADNEQY